MSSKWLIVPAIIVGCRKEVYYDSPEFSPAVPVNCVVQCWEETASPPKTTDTVTFTLIEREPQVRVKVEVAGTTLDLGSTQQPRPKSLELDFNLAECYLVEAFQDRESEWCVDASSETVTLEWRVDGDDVFICREGD